MDIKILFDDWKKKANEGDTKYGNCNRKGFQIVTSVGNSSKIPFEPEDTIINDGCFWLIVKYEFTERIRKNNLRFEATIICKRENIIWKKYKKYRFRINESINHTGNIFTEEFLVKSNGFEKIDSCLSNDTKAFTNFNCLTNIKKPDII